MQVTLRSTHEPKPSRIQLSPCRRPPRVITSTLGNPGRNPGAPVVEIQWVFKRPAKDSPSFGTRTAFFGRGRCHAQNHETLGSKCKQVYCLFSGSSIFHGHISPVVHLVEHPKNPVDPPASRSRPKLHLGPLRPLWGPNSSGPTLHILPRPTNPFRAGTHLLGRGPALLARWVEPSGRRNHAGNAGGPYPPTNGEAEQHRNMQCNDSFNGLADAEV